MVDGSEGKESACSVGDLGSIPDIFAWRIPWTEEPGRPQPMGSQRVGHDRVIFTFTFELHCRDLLKGGSVSLLCACLVS